MTRTTRIALVFVAAMTAVSAFADPVSRPAKQRHNEQGFGVRPSNPWTPIGKSGYWVFAPNPLGMGLPWVRNWIEHPHEEDAPGEPGDVGGPG